MPLTKEKYKNKTKKQKKQKQDKKTLPLVSMLTKLLET